MAGRSGGVINKGVIDYINAVYVDGETKKDSYLKYVNPSAKAPVQGYQTLEKKPEFRDAVELLVGYSEAETSAVLARSGAKLAHLLSKTIDETSQVLDKADNQKDKIRAIEVSTKLIIGMKNDNNKGAANSKKLDPSNILV